MREILGVGGLEFMSLGRHCIVDGVLVGEGDFATPLFRAVAAEHTQSGANV